MAVNPQTIMTLHSHTHGTSNRNHPQVTPNMGHVTVYDPGIVGLLRIYPSWFCLKKGYFNILQPPLVLYPLVISHKHWTTCAVCR